MRKSTKLVLLVAALVALCSIAAYASGWVQEGDEWYYNDSNGDHVYSTWKQSGNKYFYLGDEGYMLKDQLISDGSYYYYVGSDGARIENAWQRVAADDTDISTYGVDYRWYYFGANGKAYAGATKSINGKKYHFDTDGKMLYGFLDESKNMILNETDPVLTAKYYFGDNETGAMVTGWVELFVDNDDYNGDCWFYFNTSTGAKYGYNTGSYGEQKTINSVKYFFDGNGVMSTGWVATTTTAGETEYRYYNDNGSLAKSCWVNAVPDSGQNASDNTNSTSRWFYTDYTGKAYTTVTKKINGKWYTFDDAGRMKTGLVSMTYGSDNAAITDVTYVASLGDENAATVMGIDPKTNRIAYFSSSSSDGSAKTGTVQIELADDTYTFYFNKSGFAANGIVSKKLYVNGILQAAGSDVKYALKKNVNYNSGEYDYYITNVSGTVFTSATVLRDGDENYIALYKDSSDSSIHYVKIASGDYASSAANTWKTSGSLGSYEGKVTKLAEQVFNLK